MSRYARMIEQLTATAAAFRKSGDHGTAYLMEHSAAELKSQRTYAVELRRAAAWALAHVTDWVPTDCFSMEQYRWAEKVIERSVVPEISTVQESINVESQKYVDAGKPPVHAIGNTNGWHRIATIEDAVLWKCPNCKRETWATERAPDACACLSQSTVKP